MGPPVALTGGYDTEVYALDVRGAPPAVPPARVLRMLRSHHDPARVLREEATQNTLAAQGYPAPRVLLASADPTILGAPFLVMERAPGRPLTRAGIGALLRVLVEQHLRLHALDATPLARALGEWATLDGYFEAEERRIAAASLTGLGPLLAWCRRARPPEDRAPAVCHGDFHPQNILVRDGAVTAVLDWPNALVGDPAFDVAATLNVIGLVPADLAGVAGPLRWLARA
ncbi:MAG TPA: phosphotransferase, partial [Methylomirabilota bacterium]|nr:phosphotransferase [Methylomirabilota bacterium]